MLALLYLKVCQRQVGIGIQQDCCTSVIAPVKRSMQCCPAYQDTQRQLPVPAQFQQKMSLHKSPPARLPILRICYYSFLQKLSQMLRLVLPNLCAIGCIRTACNSTSCKLTLTEGAKTTTQPEWSNTHCRVQTCDVCVAGPLPAIQRPD